MAIQDRQLGLSGGVALKAPVVVASTGNLTLSSSQVIDGIVVGTSDDEGTRVLAKDQTDDRENGVYVSSGTWTRAKDFDGSRDVIPGSLVYVDRGTENARTFWTFNSSSTASSIEIGATKDSITISQVTQALGVISLTTLGDLLYHNGSAATRLPIGATNTVLVSTGTVPSWALISSVNISTGGIIAENLGSSAVTTTKIAASAVNSTNIATGAVTGPKIAIGSDAQGDILYYNGSNWTRLGAGTSGQLLETQGAGANPAWATRSTISGLSSIEAITKTADESVSSSTTLQDDDELLASLSANESVKFQLTFSVTGNSTADIKFTFTVPSGASIRWGPINGIQLAAGGGTDWPDEIEASGGTMTWGVSGSGKRRVTLIGHVDNGATAGNLQFQWAQNASNGTATKVWAGAQLLVFRE